MNRDSEAITSFLSWLLRDPDPIVSAPSGESFSQGADPDLVGAGNPQLNEIDPLDSEEVSRSLSFSESNRFSFETSALFEFGDIPAVQDRFHTLLKRRLHAEIERNPPLFPWESEVYDYEADAPDLVPELSAIPVWITQLQNLDLPVPMPQMVLAQLFEQCQRVIQSSLKEGMKLVQAVESLFPGQTPALNQLAGMVLASPVRSGTTGTRSPRTAPMEGFPGNYEAATSAQQMALSLIAAREMIESLTLTVSPDQPRVDRQWSTASGVLTLEAHYSDSGALRIQGQLPCAGSIRFRGGENQSTAQRSNPGNLSVEVFDLPRNEIYALEVYFDASEQPLIFAVKPIA